MNEMAISNVTIHAVQILVVVGLAEAGGRVAPMTAAVRLLFWRAVAVACLLLPVFGAIGAAPARHRVDGFTTTVDAISTAGTVAGLSLWQAAATIIVAGVAVRVLWLSLGLVRIAQLRANAQPAELDPATDDLRRRLAPAAVVALHPRVLQPITFGWRRPIVLLPPDVNSLPPGAQRAVVCHELLHVKRGDWLWTLLEEGPRCAFWCHPGMRWAVSKIQASREEVVDSAAVELTGARREYMNALLSFAGVPALRPAIPLVRHRHVSARIRKLAEEVRMSRTRLIVAGVLSLGLVAGCAFGAAAWLPLQAAQVTQLKAGGAIKPPKKIHDVRPVYPEDAQAAKVEGVVILDVVVGTDGAVIATSVLRSVPMLDDAAETAVRQWLFEPTLLNGEPIEVEMVVTVNFTLK